MRALITGASGFAGGHLARACADAGDEVTGISRRGVSAAGAALTVDLRVPADVREAVRSASPDVVYHLAALSSVGRSWEDPDGTVQANIASDTNLLEAVRHEAPGARLVWVSSCEVYGPAASLPAHEDAPLHPASPYAVSKTAGEQLAGIYGQAYGLDVIRARPFNHAGPGQLPIFILSSLARQAAEGRLAGETKLRLVTGNPETRRDFTDVRDVARAYRLLAAEAEPGIYNVSTGRSISAAEQIGVLAELIAPVEIEHVVDPGRVRPHEVIDLSGANDRIREATGWHPEITFRQTMLDTVHWWEQELTKAGALSN